MFIFLLTRRVSFVERFTHFISKAKPIEDGDGKSRVSIISSDPAGRLCSGLRKARLYRLTLSATPQPFLKGILAARSQLFGEIDEKEFPQDAPRMAPGGILKSPWSLSPLLFLNCSFSIESTKSLKLKRRKRRWLQKS